MAVDRYLVGNQIVSFPTKDETKSVDELLKELKISRAETREAASQRDNANSSLMYKTKEVIALNEVIEKLKKDKSILEKRLSSVSK